MKIRSLHFLSKMILFCLLIGTLPLIFLGIFSYMNASKSIEQKVQQGNMQTLTQIHSRVEQVLKNVDNSLTQYVNSSMIKQALNMAMTASDFQVVDQLLTDLYYIQTFELGVQNVSLVHLEHQWILTNGGVYRFEKSEISDQLREYWNSPLHSFWETEEYYESYISPTLSNNDMDKKNYYSVNLVKKLPINSPNPQGLVIARIPNYELSKKLTSNSELGAFMIVDRDYDILAHSDPNLIGSKVTELPSMNMLMTSTGMEGYYEDKGMGVTYVKSDYNGWTYISLVSIAEITKDSREIGWLTFIFTVSSILVIFVVSYQGSKRMYNPIRRLHHLAMNSEHKGSEERTDEIESIGQSIQNLMETQTKIHGQLQKQIPQMKYLFLLRLFQGELSEAEYKERKLDLVETQHWNTMFVLTIQMDTMENTRYEEKDKDILMFAVDNIVSELILEHNRLSPVIIGDALVLLYGTEKTEVAQIKKDINDFSKSIHKSVSFYLELSISIGISRSFTDLRDATEAYQEASDALKYRIIKDQSVTVYHEDIHPTLNAPSFPLQFEKELLDAVRSADKELSKHQLKQFLKAITQEQVSLHDYEFSLIRLAVNLIRTVQDTGHTRVIWSDGDKKIMDQLFELKNIQEIERWFLSRIIDPIINHLLLAKQDHFQTMTEQVVAIIEENYNKEVTLAMCAEALNYHPHYIGKVFRSVKGMTFSEYLQNFRLDLARKWLLETNMKISEIATELGFLNAQNFIRSFKKAEGVTPGIYREQNGKSG